MVSDIPYFEPLIFFLKQDEDLKKFFHDKDFFAKPKIDPKEIDKQAKCQRPLDRGLWIYPGDTISNTDRKLDCGSKGTHTFYVTILMRCNRDRFTITEKDGELQLGGPVMEMTCIRAQLKKSIMKFARMQEKAIPPARYRFLKWQKDEMIEYIDEGCGMLNATMIFNLELI